MKKEVIGENAGKVWRVLDEHENKMSIDELLKATGLTEIQLSAALGWLSREDKVEYTEENGVLYLTIYREYYY